MADDNIDKALPNVEQTIELPSEEELVEAAQSEEDKVPNPENTEIVQGEDGSVEINFEPGAASPAEGEDHYANLAELLPDDILEIWVLSYLITTHSTKHQEKIGKMVIQKV